MRLGRGVFDPRLAVLDSHGAVLADVDDTQLAMQDPFVSLVVPADGTYILRLREATYGGNDDCHYRLHIGAFPRPTAVYPLGGKAGETLTLRFFSEATGEFTQPVKLPATPEEKFGVFAELDGLPAPSPNWIRVSDFPNVLEASPNQDREHATATDLLPPLALNGVISQKGEEDWFRFPATKGVALDVSVYARRLGSPLDSVLEVFDAKGRSLAANDDAVGADSALKFTPPETTNYFVRIRDTLGHGGPRLMSYRVEVTPVAPHLAVKIPEVARNDTQSRQFIAVPRGNRFATLISAKRANFGGELVFGAEGLPPGVTLQADRMAANIDAMPLVFEAAPDAPIGGRLLDLTATWTNGTSKVTGKFHQDIELVQGPNNTTYYGTSVDKLCVAVTREAPFKLAIVDPKVPLVQAGSMRLEIAAEREPGFDEPIEVQMVWNPPGVSSQPEATIPKGATNVFYQLNAGGGAEIRSWKIAVLGHATVAGGQMYVSSQLADLEVAAPFLTGKIETLWVNPGKPGKLTVNLQPAKPFEGKATIRLCGLPEKVSAPEKTITKDDQEVVFDLTVDPNVPGGFVQEPVLRRGRAPERADDSAHHRPGRNPARGAAEEGGGARWPRCRGRGGEGDEGLETFTGQARAAGNPKPEGRSPKEGRNPKPESSSAARSNGSRMTWCAAVCQPQPPGLALCRGSASGCLRPSGFGLLSGFGFRPSDLARRPSCSAFCSPPAPKSPSRTSSAILLPST